MQHVDVSNATQRLPELIDAAINGEDIYIDTDDQRAVQLVPVVQPKRRQFGSAKGLIWMAEDFDAPLEDFKDYME